MQSTFAKQKDNLISTLTHCLERRVNLHFFYMEILNFILKITNYYYFLKNQVIFLKGLFIYDTFFINEMTIIIENSLMGGGAKT